VAKLWAALVLEFTQKSQITQAHIWTELMNMRSTPGADLHAEFDRLRAAYDNCLAAGITVSDEEYSSLVISFCPPLLLAYIAQVSANMRINLMIHSTSTLAAGTAAPTFTL